MAERIQRFMMAGLIALGLLLHARGFAWGLYIDWFVAVMITFWGLTGICPSLLVLRRLGIPSEAGKP